MKKSLLTTLLLASLFSFVSAQSSLGDTEPGDEGTLSSSEKVCYDLQRNLGQKNIGIYRNSDRYTNNEVTKLQNFLQDYNFLNVEATGYFGTKTLAAVKSFQRSSNILASGYVGPITRAKIKEMSCGGGVTPTCNSEQHLENGSCKTNTTAYTCSSGTIIQVPINISQTAKDAQCPGSQTTVTPTFSYTKNPSGTSPLSVDFYVAKNISNCSYASGYSVDFGDGTSANVSVDALNSPNSNTSVQCGGYFAKHVYASTGTYTAKLMKNTCPAGAQCFAGPTVVGTLIISLTEVPKNGGTTPGVCPDGTPRQTTVGGSGTGCEGHGEGTVTPPAIIPKMSSSNSPTGPFAEFSLMVNNAYIVNYAPLYTRTSGLIKANQPKGCMQKVGETTCTSGSYTSSSYRDFTSSEWISSDTVQTSMSELPKLSTDTAYEGYVRYSTGPAIKTGQLTLLSLQLFAGNVANGGNYVRNGTVNSSSPVYTQIRGVLKQYEPKGCAQPAGASSCQTGEGYRSFTLATDSWPPHNTIQTVIQNPQDFPVNTSYEVWIKYQNGSPINVGTFRLNP